MLLFKFIFLLSFHHDTYIRHIYIHTDTSNMITRTHHFTSHVLIFLCVCARRVCMCVCKNTIFKVSSFFKIQNPYLNFFTCFLHLTHMMIKRIDVTCHTKFFCHTHVYVHIHTYTRVCNQQRLNSRKEEEKKTNHIMLIFVLFIELWRLVSLPPISSFIFVFFPQQINFE